MTVTINGTTGVSGVDGSAGTPALQGSDSNTGIFFGADTVTVSTGGTAAVTVDSGQRTKFPTTIAVGNATPSTSGSGITFPATQAASTDVNTLDDYEEGSWNPVLTPASGTITANAANDTGAYTKVGRLVTVTGQIVFTSSSASGTIILSGLPFSVANLTETSERFCGNVRLGGFTTGDGLGFVLVDSGTSGAIFTSTGGTPVIAASGSEIYINFSYFAA